jgi:hypothetical protein
MGSRWFAVMGVAGLVVVLATCTGDRGPTGPQGVLGTPGSPGVSGVEIATVTQSITINGTAVTVRADCPTGKHVLGGGFSHVPTDPSGTFETIAQNDYPSSPTSWTVTVASEFVIATTITVYAICGFTT